MERERNQLLAALTEIEWSSLQHKLEEICLERKRLIYEQGSRIEELYFPLTAVFSLLSVMEDGRTAVIGAVGSEGIVEVCAALSITSAISRCTVQVQGMAARIGLQDLQLEASRHEHLKIVLQTYAEAFLFQLTTAVGCSSTHTVEQRCARWLLTLRDRSRSADFLLPRQSLREMLGLTAYSVDLVLDDFQAAGLIAYSSGITNILDPPGLEARSCSCYAALRRRLGSLA